MIRPSQRAALLDSSALADQSPHPTAIMPQTIPNTLLVNCCPFNNGGAMQPKIRESKATTRIGDYSFVFATNSLPFNFTGSACACFFAGNAAPPISFHALSTCMVMNWPR